MTKRQQMEEEERELQVIRMKFLRDLVLNKKKWGHLKAFEDVRKIIHSHDETLHLTQLGIGKNDKKNIFIFLKEKMKFDVPNECRETMETVDDFIACVYVISAEKHFKVVM